MWVVFNVTNIYTNLESSCNSRTKTDFERFLSLSSASILNSILRKLMYHVSFPKKYLRHTKSYRVFDSLRKMNMLIIFHKFNLFLVERLIGIWIDFSRFIYIYMWAKSFYFPRTYANSNMCGMYLNQTKHQTAFFVTSINAMLITCSTCDRLRSCST